LGQLGQFLKCLSRPLLLLLLIPHEFFKLNSTVPVLRLWAQREGVRDDDSGKLFSVIARRYVREIYLSKAVRTRADNDKELIHLLRVFGHMPIDAIMPMHIREYMDIRARLDARLHRWHHRNEAKIQSQLPRLVAFIGAVDQQVNWAAGCALAFEQPPALGRIVRLSGRGRTVTAVRASAATK
jgi:hypothetical protein